ncbi:MAG: hypothetical protein M3076_19170 [Actinomycetota bacterium]|nr:hypothetical protein [Actinomycetota bacterium]
MSRPPEEGERLVERYSDEQLALFIQLAQLTREVQERHAAWLRKRLRENQWGPTSP